MGLLTFKGGIHPDDGKRFSKDSEIRTLLPKGELAYPLSQHIGAPANPIVKKGDHVLKGQKIAEAGGFVSSPIHASVSGTVKGIEYRFNPAGTKTECIIIENDGEYAEINDLTVKPFGEMTREEIIERIGEAGIVGMGGAGFPTGLKLDVNLQGGTILVNAAECEPGLCHNIRQIEEQTDITIEGARICKEITKASKVIFAIKAKNRHAVEKLRAALQKEADMYIHLLPDIYPMGEERAVVRECLGIELNTTQLPSAANAIVCNVETLARVAEAIEERKPCFSKNLTVIGKINGGNEPHVFMDVPVGTSVGEMIERAGGIDGVYGEIIMGGPFTGHATTEDAPITKTTGGIIVTIDFPDLHGASVGLLVCACGGSEERMRDICQKMNGVVKSVARCKQAIENKPGAPLKCERPGNCPGQAKNNIQFKKDGCEYIIIGNCSDCSNTVMGSAPKMGLKVFHQTDHVMRTIGHPLYRYLRVSKQVEQLPEGK